MWMAWDFPQYLVPVRSQVMKSHTRWLKVMVIAALACLLGFSGVAAAISLVVIADDGPSIKHELFRSDGSSAIIWEEIAFSFPLPTPAIGDGVFRMFAGGDLNNLDVDRIDVTAGPFGDRTLLGTFAFPIGDVHFTGCGGAPHSNPGVCPIPETVPGGMFFDPSLGPPVGDIQGRRNTSNFDPGVPGLIVPQSLLVGTTAITISLFPRNEIFDLYIDRLELSYPIPERLPEPIPEPSTWLLLIAGLTLLGMRSGRLKGFRLDYFRIPVRGRPVS
jgi:hypothetical protein